jgi:hypothetical protein
MLEVPQWAEGQGCLQDVCPERMKTQSCLPAVAAIAGWADIGCPGEGMLMCTCVLGFRVL